MTKEGLKQTIGVNIRDMLEEAGITQNELSEETGISRSTISHYINGDKLPNVNNLINIAYALDCEITDLLDMYCRIV